MLRVECTPDIRITVYLRVKHILCVKHKHIHIFPHILTFMKILVLSIQSLSFAVIGYLISFNWWWKFCFCSFTREGWSILLWRKVLLGDKHHCRDDVEWRGLWRWIGGEVPTMAKSWSGNLTTKLDERKWRIADSVCQKTYYIRWSDEETTFKI